MSKLAYFLRFILLFILLFYVLFEFNFFIFDKPSAIKINKSAIKWKSLSLPNRVATKLSRVEFNNLKIVMPFHINQLNKLIETLTKWKTFIPCDPRSQNSTSIELVFYTGYSSSNENLLKEIDNKLPQKLECFSKISVVKHKYESQDEDKHVKGSRLMFELMLSQKYKEFMNTTFVFYMEPDVRAIKSNWLDAITRDIGNGKFWLKGSAFRGDMKKFARNDPYLPNYMHINGNAIYKIGDYDLRSFYFDTLRPYIVKKNGDSLNAYDTDFFEFLFDKANYETTRNIIHNFHFTSLIQNFWQTEYNVLQVSGKFPDTYFIHGGYPIY